MSQVVPVRNNAHVQRCHMTLNAFEFGTMHAFTTESQLIAHYIRQQADHCIEVSHAVPNDMCLDGTPREMWMAMAGVLSSVADDIENGRHLSQGQTGQLERGAASSD